MGRLFEGYRRHARLIGVLYCIIPTVAWFIVVVALNPLREVYLLRVGISVTVGSYIAARANEYGVRLWLAKHRSPDGPATVGDGAILGSFVGLASSLIPPLTSLIGTRHPEEAKLFIIASWLLALFNGCWVGALVARSGLKGQGPNPARKEPA